MTYFNIGYKYLLFFVLKRSYVQLFTPKGFIYLKIIPFNVKSTLISKITSPSHYLHILK